MEFIIILIILAITYIAIRIVFGVNMKKIKEISEDKELDDLVGKYPENIEICKNILNKLENNTVKIEEDKEANTTLYLVMNNKILIANLKQNYTRIQTIAHECLHSIQDKKILWSNFIFSNMYILYFIIITILTILKILPYKMMFFSILLLCGLVYYIIRTYLENDAMIKARFLAKEYMEEANISSKDEINKIIEKYDELNNIGIKCVNFKIFSSVIIKSIIFSFFALAF